MNKIATLILAGALATNLAGCGDERADERNAHLRDCYAGKADACDQFASMAEKGIGGAADEESAKSMRLRATQIRNTSCEQGNIAACPPSGSAALPSDADVRAVFEHVLRQASGNAQYNIIGFETHKKETFDSHGVKSHIIQYNAVVAFPEGVRPDCIPETPGATVSQDCDSYLRQDPASPFRKVRVGETIDAWGVLPFEYTNNGWRGQDGKIY